jgi:SAM-dependent methyltransferase
MSVSPSFIDKYYPSSEHPYRILERAIHQRVTRASTVLDIGCGREAPALCKLAMRIKMGIGIDPVVQPVSCDNITALPGFADRIPLADSSVDVVYSRSVLEHLADPLSVFREVQRVLRPGGRFLALTPSLWDYATVLARLIPNSLHPWIVRHTEGRSENDTFPTHYQANTEKQLRRLALRSGLELEAVSYLNQYPGYLVFSRPLFLLGMAYERLTSRFHSLRKLRGWVFCVLRKPVAGSS